MAGNNYKKGRQAEYLAITHLKKEGYFWCQRSYASKGMFDVHGMGADGGVLIQVKRTKRQKIVPSMYKKEMEEIQEWVDSLPDLPEIIRVEWWVQREGIRGWTKWRFRPNQEPEMFEGNVEGSNK
jgi:hypothetical protein